MTWGCVCVWESVREREFTHDSLVFDHLMKWRRTGVSDMIESKTKRPQMTLDILVRNHTVGRWQCQLRKEKISQRDNKLICQATFTCREGRSKAKEWGKRCCRRYIPGPGTARSSFAASVVNVSRNSKWNFNFINLIYDENTALNNYKPVFHIPTRVLNIITTTSVSSSIFTSPSSPPSTTVVNNNQ